MAGDSSPLVRRLLGLARAVVPYLLMIAGTFAVGEVGARALGVRPLTTGSLLWSHHPRWGWFHQPDAEADFVKPGFVQRVRINSLGLRERPIPYAKPEGIFRILVIGDSSVVSFEVAPEQVFTRVAEDLLQRRGLSVQFVNGGVRGYGTDQALLFLEEEGLKYRPDLVLYKWTGNDPDDNATIHRPFRKYGKPWFDLDESGGLILKGVPVPIYDYHSNLRVGDDGEPVELAVDARSATTLWLRDVLLCRSAFATALLKLALSLPQMSGPVAGMGSYDDTKDVKVRLDPEDRIARVTAALIQRMQRVSREAGAEFAMIDAYEPWGELLFEMTGLAPLGDVELYFERLPAGEPVHVPFDPHWNELGHQIYGEILAEVLAGSDLLRSVRTAHSDEAGPASVQ